VPTRCVAAVDCNSPQFDCVGGQCCVGAGQFCDPGGTAQRACCPGTTCTGNTCK
jgi:hypothetical protein